MQVQDVGLLVAFHNPRGKGRAEESELVGIGRKRLGCGVVAVDAPLSLRRKACMFKHDVANRVVVAGDFIDVDRFHLTAKQRGYFAAMDCAVQFMECAIRRCHNGCVPAKARQGERQIVYDVGHTTDFAAR